MKFLQALCLGIAALANVNPVDAQPYQARATEWLVNDPFDGGFIINSLRYGLACLYFATYDVDNIYSMNPGPWKRNTGWLTATSFCTWYGVTCNDEGIITEIDLSDNNVAGSFPQELTLIADQLESLDLSGNPIASIGGDLSWIAAMKNLRRLDLYFCNMDFGGGVPPYFSELKKLEYLDISYCFFYGDLDGAPFKDMTKLTYLDIGGNGFYGSSVPDEIAELPKLEVLLMGFSGLRGDLSWFDKLNAGIFEVWADFNYFDGSIPTTIGRFQSLASLSLTSCSLTGELPTELGDLKFMQQMWFYNNSLTGDIPSQIGDLDLLKTFQTEDNMFDNGDMPDEICDLTKNGLLDQLSTDCEGDKPIDCPCCGCCASTDEDFCFPAVVTFFACFPGASHVNVLDKGILRMDEIKIGDNVDVGDGKFSKVYGFGHYNQDGVAEFLQLFGSDLNLPLEITKDHMVFIEERGAVPAGNVKVGDNLVLTDGTTAVTKISTVKRAGVFAPFTHSGTIAVNNVVASSYVSLQEGAEHLTVGGVKLASHHWIAHALQAPHRIVCNLNANFCAKETYTKEGIATWVHRPLLAAQWFVEQNPTVIAIISVPVLLISGVCLAVESIFMNAGLFALAVASYVFVSRRAGSKQSA